MHQMGKKKSRPLSTSEITENKNAATLASFLFHRHKELNFTGTKRLNPMVFSAS